MPLSLEDLLNRPAPVATKRIIYGNDIEQFGDLYLPDNAGPHPVVVMIHGGCWQASLPGVVLMSYLAEDLRKNGYAVWNLEYRRLGDRDGGYPGTFMDIADGIDYLRQISDTYKLDLTKVQIVGHSAGGQLALWAAGRKNIPTTSPLYRANPLPMQGAISLAGINDLKAYRNGGVMACGGPDTIDQLIDARNRAGDPYADTSPSEMLPLKVRQMVVSGTQDAIVPSQFGVDYGKMAQAKGDSALVLTMTGAGHFDLIDPQNGAWKQVKSMFGLFQIQ